MKKLIFSLLAALLFSGTVIRPAAAQTSPRFEKLYLATDKDCYHIGEKIWFSGHLVNSHSLRPISKGSNFIYVELLDSSDSLCRRVKIKRDSLGFHNCLELSQDLPQGRYRLRAYTRWMLNFDRGFLFDKNIEVINPVRKEKKENKEKSRANGFDLQFFPESGHLLAQTWQTVAFKAIGSDGWGADVEVELYDSRHELVARAASLHRGMGFLMVNLSAEEKYEVQARCKGITRKFPFPEVSTSGVSIRCLDQKSQFAGQITISGDLNPADYDLIVHSRGTEIHRQSLQKHVSTLIFPKKTIPDGISSFLVLDKRTNEPVARRLIFVNHRDTIGSDLSTGNCNFGPREKTKLDIRLTDSEGQAAEGRFSISVTDLRAQTDTTADDIRSFLLLSSDLKGYIEDPRHYFEDAGGAKDADLLMLTQGWVSYAQANEYKKTELKHYIEDEQMISGEIFGFFGNKAKSPQIMFAEPKSRIFDIIPLGDDNRFNIHTDFKDSTIFFLEACYKNGKKGNTLSLEMDPEHFAPVPYRRPLKRIRQAQEVDSTYEELAQKDLYYSTDGALFFNLEGTTIYGEREASEEDAFDITGSHSLSGNELEPYQGWDVYELAKTLPGVTGNGDSLYIRGNYYPAVFYLDDIPVEYSDVRNLPVSSVKSIQILTDLEATFLSSNGMGGMFLVKMKDGAELEDVNELPCLAKIKPLGWKTPARYYQPKYQIDSLRTGKKPDLRTTVAWEPVVKTDAEGRAHLNFWTSDQPDRYRVQIQGVTTDGRIICSEQYIGKESSR